MYEKAIRITSSHGIHARPASELVKLTNQFNSHVTIIKGDVEVNAKSIMGIFILAIARGDEIIVRANGDDEQELVNSLENLIKNNFQPVS